MPLLQGMIRLHTVVENDRRSLRWQNADPRRMGIAIKGAAFYVLFHELRSGSMSNNPCAEFKGRQLRSHLIPLLKEIRPIGGIA